jgi:hypothetical protein
MSDKEPALYCGIDGRELPDVEFMRLEESRNYAKANFLENPVVDLISQPRKIELIVKARGSCPIDLREDLRKGIHCWRQLRLKRYENVCIVIGALELIEHSDGCFKLFFCVREYMGSLE